MTVTGLIGFPVSHSLSPRIHAYWRAQYNVEGDYKLFTTAPARLRQTMHHMRKKNWRGVNVTVPHKQDVMEYLDSIDTVATKIGAVNTVTNENGELKGSNTDAYGFITNLKEKLGGALAPALSNVIVFGAGGAARAIVSALQDEAAASITLINRTFRTAEHMADEFAVQALPWDVRQDAITNATLIVNTTSLGMEYHPALDIALTPEHRCAVADIVYAPLDTPLLKNARHCGLQTVDGLGMLLYQAQLAFETWHGTRPEVTEELRAHVLASDA